MCGIDIILGLWKSGFIESEDVVKWADEKILKIEEVPDALITLSLKGPYFCSKLPSYEFPPAITFSFSECFLLRLSKIDLNSKSEVEEFIEWAANSSRGLDYKVPEVFFGMYVSDLWDQEGNLVAAHIYANENLPNFIQKSIILEAELGERYA